MPNQTIGIQLSDPIGQRLQQVTHAPKPSIAAVLLQTVRGSLPPSVDAHSPRRHGVMAHLSYTLDEAQQSHAIIASAPAEMFLW
jgi:hypothetical protein